ncbi:MAG: asparagine synthase (glutamine-hydrolyzing) [Bacteroidota bacterium]|nr:asparagine synthase (glutamine-hydrolyzing) [Bacteroidota bacterium]
MCGIAGFLSTTYNQDDLCRITRSVSHRGPDAEGFYFNAEDGIGLGHRRLSIIDLSAAANQPFYSKDRRYVMIFNGEIYNFRDLIRRYNLQTSTSSDTEVVIELFARHGVEVIKELNGMFALAIWDTRDKELFIFRDRFGVKPLFYYRDEQHLVFASELKAIKANGRISLEVNEQSFGYYFHLGFIPGPHTAYKKVFKLNPGEYIRIRNQKLHIEKFVSLSQFAAEKTITDETEALNKIEELLAKAVERQTIADVPLGVFLSGGTDSSLIAALTKKVSGGKIKTFSVGFSNSSFDELPYASKVAKYLDTEHHEIHITDKQMLDKLYEIIDAYDEPYIIASGFPTFSISEFTRKHVTVALSGEGSDEMFMGYGFHLWAKRMEQFPLKQLGGLIGRGLMMSQNIAHQQKGRLFKNAGKYFAQSHIFSQEQFYFSIDDIASHFSPCCGQASLQKFGMDFPSQRKFNAEEKQSWFDINVYLVDDLLTKVDRASMHYGLEARVPFLDNDLFNYVINLDSKLKINNGNGKYLLKKILYKYIPEEYFNRRKWGFAPPLVKWMKSDLRPVIETYLEPSIVSNFGLVNNDYVQRLKKEYYKGNDRLYNKIWLLALIHIWLSRNT